MNQATWWTNIYIFQLTVSRWINHVAACTDVAHRKPLKWSPLIFCWWFVNTHVIHRGESCHASLRLENVCAKNFNLIKQAGLIAEDSETTLDLPDFLSVWLAKLFRSENESRDLVSNIDPCTGQTWLVIIWWYTLTHISLIIQYVPFLNKKINSKIIV